MLDTTKNMRRDKFDKVVSDLVRAMNRNTCESCGKVGRSECAHIMGRRHAGTRYDLGNLLCLCHYCHRKYTENPIDFTRWLEDYIGEEAIDNLRLKAWKVHKWKAGEKEAMYKKHKEMLAECIDNA